MHMLHFSLTLCPAGRACSVQQDKPLLCADPVVVRYLRLSWPTIWDWSL